MFPLFDLFNLCMWLTEGQVRTSSIYQIYKHNQHVTLKHTHLGSADATSAARCVNHSVSLPLIQDTDELKFPLRSYFQEAAVILQGITRFSTATFMAGSGKKVNGSPPTLSLRLRWFSNLGPIVCHEHPGMLKGNPEKDMIMKCDRSHFISFIVWVKLAVPTDIQQVNCLGDTKCI